MDNDASTELITIITLLKKKQSNVSTFNHHEHEGSGAADNQDWVPILGWGMLLKFCSLNSQILKFLFINITEGGDFHFLVCFYLLCLFHTNRKCNCFTGLWNQIFEPISEFYLIVRLKITGKFQRHTVEKGNFFFLMLAILRRFKLLSHQNSNINMETIPWLPAFSLFS